MSHQVEYQHPQVSPLCQGTWQEVVFSWVIALATVAAILAAL